MTDPDRMFVHGLLAGAWAAQAAVVVAELGVAEALADGPRPLDELAKAVGADPAALGRVLRALSSIGVFEPVGDSYAANGSARLLGEASVRRLGAEVLPLLGRLGSAVRQGRPAADDSELLDSLFVEDTAPLRTVVAAELSGRIVEVTEEDVPEEGDVYLLDGVLGRCTDDDAAKVLGRIPAGAKAIVLEPVVPDGPGFAPAKLDDLVVLLLSRRPGRTEREYRELLRDNGFEVTAVHEQHDRPRAAIAIVGSRAAG
jgi:hypothetical protein